jgi:hypothetical protein
MTAHFSENGRPKTIRPALPPKKPDGEYVKTELDQRLDRLTLLWNATEAKLLRMQVPRCIEYHFDTQVLDDDGQFEEYHHLGIQRYSGKWRLCYGSYGTGQMPEVRDWKPLVECNVDLRVHAVKFIDGLKEKIIDSGKKFIPQMDEAIKGLEKFLADEL